MPTINESELSGGQAADLCSQCNEFEGAIFLCGEGMICETCFADLAGIPEEELFIPARPLLDFEIPVDARARAKAKLMRKEDVATS